MDEFRQRLNNLREQMETAGIDIAIIHFFIDIYYFSGANQLSTLIVPRDDDPTLFVQVGIDVARKDSWIRDIRALEGMNSLRDFLSVGKNGNVTFGINEDTVPGTLYRKYRESFPAAKFMNISPVIQKIRSIKSDKEVNLIEKTAAVSSLGHAHVREVLKPGLTELDLSAAVEHAIRRNGHSGCSITRRGGYALPAGPMAISGPKLGVISGNGAITMTGTGLSPALPMGASQRKMTHGDMVAVDVSTHVNGYHSDEARMYIIGQPDEQQENAFEVIFNAYQAAIDAIRPGVRSREVYYAAVNVIERAGYLDYFAAFSRYPKYSYLGHGVGLEAIEFPLIDPRNETVLQPNMVIAIEPKLIAPHWGCSLEDTILVTDDGYRVLTKTKRALIVV